MPIHFLQDIDVSYLCPMLLENGLLKVVSSSVYKTIPGDHLAVFGHHKGFYCFPTIELADWLKQEIDLTTTIEIGAGNGALARYLKIPATDSKYMENPEIKLFYTMTGQPVTIYPEDIIKLDAIAAVSTYKPKAVIGCWVTHKYREEEHERGGNMFGVDEDTILSNVDKYIVIGNELVHSKKKILELPHKEYKFPWLFSRSMNQSKNIIYVWEK